MLTLIDTTHGGSLAGLSFIPRQKRVTGLGAFDLSQINTNLNSFITTGLNIFDVVSGQKAARDAQQVQLQLAQVQAQRIVAEEAARAQSMSPFWAALPWALGAVGGLVVIAMVVKK